jgi:regulator of protease activity HflC (stomatin/prohibitin superfamily)
LLPWVVIHPYQRGVLLRLGTFVKVLEPGFHWILPLGIDEAPGLNVMLKTHRIPGLATTTKDGRQVGFDAVVSYRITDVQKALLEVDDVQDAIIDTCAGIVGTTLADNTWEELLHGAAIEGLTKACRQRGWRYGVEILGVQLTGLALVRTIRLSGLLGDGHYAHLTRGSG